MTAVGHSLYRIADGQTSPAMTSVVMARRPTPIHTTRDRATSTAYMFYHSVQSVITAIGGGASTPIGHWRSSSKTGTSTISFGLSVFESKTVGLALKCCLGWLFRLQNAQKNCFRPGLLPGSRWENIDAPADHLVGWGAVMSTRTGHARTRTRT